MKFCPTCQTRYDEEILRFCTKDGTPLVEENPSFAALPSEESTADDIGEETVIRRNPPRDVPLPPPDDDDFSENTSQQRVVIPVNEFGDPVKEPIRAKPLPPPAPVRKSNTPLVVLATILGTIIALGALALGWYALRGRNETSSNQNINVNTASNNSNLNTNYNADTSLANFNAVINANTNANTNVNANANANLKTPTPTRTPTPTPSPTPDDNANANSNTNVGNGNINATPRPSPAPTASPNQTPRPSASPTQPAVNVGVMNSRAANLPKPAYPQAAKDANASGQVMVQISVDESGNVLNARAVSGHPLLRASAENAARQSRFNPVKVDNQAVRANGLVVYNFINQ